MELKKRLIGHLKTYFKSKEDELNKRKRKNKIPNGRNEIKKRKKISVTQINESDSNNDNDSDNDVDFHGDNINKNNKKQSKSNGIIKNNDYYLSTECEKEEIENQNSSINVNEIEDINKNKIINNNERNKKSENFNENSNSGDDSYQNLLELEMNDNEELFDKEDSIKKIQYIEEKIKKNQKDKKFEKKICSNNLLSLKKIENQKINYYENESDDMSNIKNSKYIEENGDHHLIIYMEKNYENASFENIKDINHGNFVSNEEEEEEKEEEEEEEKEEEEEEEKEYNDKAQYEETFENDSIDFREIKNEKLISNEVEEEEEEDKKNKKRTYYEEENLDVNLNSYRTFFKPDDIETKIEWEKINREEEVSFYKNKILMKKLNTLKIY
ncbi:hypothetical protein LY90DRAFT_515198 [Neocallimastix californiae]|uniref:Uncharacterized protein n=1 Tax=Neocallimastix californiae TaxID=1754190 RepID=A0A1Y2AKC2_9FUNG|nr:hypothetical protein LY90DRAFT_515198 [Neocallimastix californiae]|eukprot:ORY23003.1 hypothetical protein LY90DRAFT_515198 [Neocallimastix californiae]